jgi:hypothetical protein
MEPISDAGVTAPPEALETDDEILFELFRYRVANEIKLRYRLETVSWEKMIPIMNGDVRKDANN